MSWEWRLAVKFDPQQPREPAGGPGGGRWTATGTQATQFTGNTQADAALAEWDDFEAASVMTAASRGEDLSHHMTTGGERFTPVELERYKKQAAALQKEASASNTGERVLHRGTTSASPETEYLRNGKVTTSGLVTAAKDEAIARIYADPQYSGGEGRGVMLHYESPRGVPGFMRNNVEAILPGGIEFRVSRTWEEGDLFHVTLYRSSKQPHGKR